ncbi:hypothetical protein K435DRAFT_809716 [Dendrothele bispora CBS 962.96]|uniref:Uncharacterized protein n=1 Tax=Dendrothele bispora (strain CBS 962.96) TaxID=1314807 RepID=A0A4S8KXC1_DENBC|nr:hypothetical protein K435DRAFT_809716 [Dendrothele bispora CBS 962.96]
MYMESLCRHLGRQEKLWDVVTEVVMRWRSEICSLIHIDLAKYNNPKDRAVPMCITEFIGDPILRIFIIQDRSSGRRSALKDRDTIIPIDSELFFNDYSKSPRAGRLMVFQGELHPPLNQMKLVSSQNFAKYSWTLVLKDQPSSETSATHIECVMISLVTGYAASGKRSRENIC